MNLAKLDTAAIANQGAKMEVRGPDGSLLKTAGGAPVTITLLGADSDVAVRARNATTNRLLKNRGRTQITAESALDDTIALLAKCTVGWEGIGIDEDDTPFSQEAAAKLYERFPFIREQADEFVAERANFLQA